MTYGTTDTTTLWEVWAYREPGWRDMDLTEFAVEARDGEIGKIDNATHEVDRSYLIVDTGPWIFGKKVMLPAGVVSGIDMDNRRVMVDRTKEQIKNAPEFDESMLDNDEYRERYRAYYDRGGPGWYDHTR